MDFTDGPPLTLARPSPMSVTVVAKTFAAPVFQSGPAGRVNHLRKFSKLGYSGLYSKSKNHCPFPCSMTPESTLIAMLPRWRVLLPPASQLRGFEQTQGVQPLQLSKQLGRSYANDNTAFHFRASKGHQGHRALRITRVGDPANDPKRSMPYPFCPPPPTPPTSNPVCSVDDNLSNHDPLNFFQRYLVLAPVVEPSGSRAFMIRHRLGNLQLPAVA